MIPVKSKIFRWTAASASVVALGLAISLPYVRAAWYSWEGDRLQRTGRLDEAANAYQKSLDARHSPATLEKLGDTFVQDNRPGAAVEALQEAVRLTPHNAAAHYKLGLGLMHSGNTDLARQEMNQAIVLDPGNAMAHLAMSDLSARTGDPAGSTRELEQAVEDGADTPDVHLRLGRIYLARGDERAEREFRAVLALDPNNVRANMRLGLLILETSPSQAAVHLQNALQAGLSDTDDEARTFAAMAVISYRSDDMVNARNYLQQAMDLNPSPRVQACLDYASGVIQHREGDSMTAMKSFASASREWPEESTFQAGDLVGRCSLYGAALTAERTGKAGQSEEATRALVSLDPTQPDYRLELGNALMMRHATSAAVAEYRAAIKLNPNDPEAWLKLAMALIRQDRAQEASQAMSVALKQAPLWPRTRPDVDVLLGRINLATNHPQVAESYLRYAVSSRSTLINPDECIALLRIATERVQDLNYPILTTTGGFETAVPKR